MTKRHTRDCDKKKIDGHFLELIELDERARQYMDLGMMGSTLHMKIIYTLQCSVIRGIIN